MVTHRVGTGLRAYPTLYSIGAQLHPGDTVEFGPGAHIIGDLTFTSVSLTAAQPEVFGQSREDVARELLRRVVRHFVIFSAQSSVVVGGLAVAHAAIFPVRCDIRTFSGLVVAVVSSSGV
jgi:hypothetical protein